MACPHCAAPGPYEPGRETALGYCTFRCRACMRTSNGRTGTPFTHPEYPTDVVLPAVRWRLPHTLSLLVHRALTEPPDRVIASPAVPS